MVVTTAKPTIMVAHDEEVKTQVLNLIESKEWDSLMELVNTNKSAARTVLSAGATVDAGKGNLALHEVCKSQPTLKLVTALIDAFPDATKAKGCWGYLPLHYACTSRASKEVVAALLEAHPGGSRTYDDHQGVLPLHLACKWGASRTVVTSILTKYPEAIFMKDASKKVPMDYAQKLHKSSKQPVISALELGPYLVAASKAAQRRMGDEHAVITKNLEETKRLMGVEHEAIVKGLKKAHAEHAEQWAGRCETERLEKEHFLAELAGTRTEVASVKALKVELTEENERVQNEMNALRKELENVKALNLTLGEQLNDSKQRMRYYEGRMEELKFLLSALSVNLTNWNMESVFTVQKKERIPKGVRFEDEQKVDMGV
uniref:Uncharacterized protein n=1 Tax=Grammatophora oceanica TaxID=210454 RepID=A0A7S1UR07_9STRA|mmetsp:Transcript_14124/g.20694  ORF Transcript_14124/g.20694 Transcript_14124/m.20694 type:complete len:374 (+) Transcript_14124:103-1224(+)|eukprot:CAMPEP_0194029164 /NCGR_PEP_ID=MMETSP0009_2-20130614/2980_1 /TAXON_ID=210454 /ORGANISM="Grammatophora oceanica, Strain CCMP 410" /LENGTH=373 /DNA_ID=CAMNT_0038668763 /DNA_START=67 /DNA_END=1188 /DNA_ORIENTATION=-